MPVDFIAYVDALLKDPSQPELPSGMGRAPTAMLPPIMRPPKPPKDAKPGTLGRMAAGFGTAMGWAKEKVDVASNYYSNEHLRNRVLRGEPPVPSEVLLKEGLIAPPEPGMSKEERYARSIGRGITEGVGRVVTDPVAMTLMGGGMGMAPKLLQKPMHAGFMAMMGHGMYEGGKQAYATYREQGFTPSVAEELAKVGVDAGLIASPFVARRFRGRPQPAAAERQGPRMPYERPAVTERPEPTGFEMRPEETGFEMRPEPSGFDLMPEGGGLVPAGARSVSRPRDRQPPTVMDLGPPPPLRLPPGSGEGLPAPGRPSPANVSRVPERLNIAAHQSVLNEVNNRLRRAVGEGDQQAAIELIKLREAIRESAWQSQPGSASTLRAGYEAPGVTIDAVQQPQNRPRMLHVRANLAEMLSSEQNPNQRAKIRVALASLDAQLRQNPLPTPPPPQLMPGQPQAPPGGPGGLPPGGAPPAGPTPPPGGPGAALAPIPGPPGMAPTPPGVAPEARMPGSAPRMAGEGMGPTGALPERPGAAVDVGERTAALVQAAQERGAGLPGELAPPGAGPGMPVAVEGPMRGAAARAAEPIRAVDAEGQALVPGFVEAAQGTPQMTEGNLPGELFTPAAEAARGRTGPLPKAPTQAELPAPEAPTGKLRRAGFLEYAEGTPTEGLGEMPYVPEGRRVGEWSRLKDQVRSAEEAGAPVKEAAARIAEGYPEEIRLNIERQADMLLQNREIGREYLETLNQRDAMRREAGEQPSEILKDPGSKATVELWGKPKQGDYIYRAEGGEIAAGAAVSQGSYDFIIGGERIMDLPAEGAGAIYRVTKAQKVRSTVGVTPAGMAAQQRAAARGLDVTGGLAEVVGGGERGREGPTGIERGPLREAVPAGEPGPAAPEAPRGEAPRRAGTAPGAERQPARSKLDARLKREAAERERVLNLLADAPGGRVTSAWLVEQGLPKRQAVQMTKALETEGLLEWVRSKKDYRLTKEGRAAVEKQIGAEPAPEKPPPAKPAVPKPKAPKVAKRTAPRLAATKKTWVDRETKLAIEGLQESVRKVDEAGNLKTYAEGEATRRKGYDQRDLVEDHINGIAIDPNAEYVLNQSKLKGFRAKVRERIEREYEQEVAEQGPPFTPKRILAKTLQGSKGLEAGSVYGEGPYYSTGPLIVAGKAPRGVTKTRPLESMVAERISGARRTARERAELDYVEGDTARLRLADGTEVSIPAEHYGHVTKAAGKAGATWFGKAGDPNGAVVAYKGALEAPGKKPFAVVAALTARPGRFPKGVAFDDVPARGPELAAFETAAAGRIADARAGERGAVSLDLLTAPAMVVRDAIVLGARAIRGGLTKFGPWASEMGRVLGKGVKGLKDLFRWAGSYFGAGRSPSGQVIPPGQKGAASRAAGPYEVPAAEPAPTPKGAARGIGMKGKVVRPGEADVYRSTKWQGPLRKGEKPAATDFPINTERITPDPQMRELQHRAAEAMKPTLNKNRSHRSWKTAEKTALEAGLSKRQFESLVRERGSVTDAEMLSGRKLREDYAEIARAKHKEWQALKESDTARPEEVSAAEEAKLAAVAEWASVTAHSTAAAAETARALSIMRRISKAMTPEERLYQQAIKFGMRKGADPKLMDQLADAVIAKDHAKIAELGTQIMQPTTIDKINEFFVNNILSAPPTPAANVLGNWGHENLLRTPERGIAGMIEVALAKKQGRAPERLPQEAFEALKANWHMGFGFSKQFTKNLRDIFIENPWDPEMGQLKGEWRPPSLPGKFGKVWRTPSRALRVLDKAARSAAYEAEVASQVYREAFNTGRARGFTGEKLTAHMETKAAGLLKDIQRWREIDVIRRINGDKALDAGMKDVYLNETLNRIGKASETAARESTFQDMPGAFARAALHLRNTHPWLTLFVPFISTPSRILTRAVERTPFGLARAAKRAYKGETRGGKAADELARGIWGTAIAAGLYGLAESGVLTGSGPTNPRERSVWRKQGREPYSLKIGDTWYSMARLEPLATVLGLAADLSETKNAKKAGDIADKLVATMTNNVFSKTYLDGIASIIEAVSDPERYGSTYAKKFVGSVAVPNIVATLARATDPYVRETGPMEGLPAGVNLVAPTIMSRIPGVSRTLPARVTGTGEPIKREEHPVSRMLSPVRYRREKGKEAAFERLMLDVGYIPSRPPKSITVPGTGGRKTELRQKEKDVYARHMRQATKVARRLAADSKFMKLDPLLQEKELKKLYRLARDRAFRIVGPAVVRRFVGAR